ncbi:hypothetical protein COCON_G00001180 [Conger conger]|uniref:Ig-like domain-containing protein n=1 Tax=Conger conger TaxID=82655 RepID=A0A9Q1I7A9_CONCO|nr:hypothetical protein COCON_G00001180 [Conger conger]
MPVSHTEPQGTDRGNGKVPSTPLFNLPTPAPSKTFYTPLFKSLSLSVRTMFSTPASSSCPPVLPPALQVRVNPGSVTEGQSVTLTCSTTCTLTGSPAFTWYRDGSPLSFTTQTHQLTASSEDGGTYSCAVNGSELLPSPAVALTVN